MAAASVYEASLWITSMVWTMDYMSIRTFSDTDSAYLMFHHVLEVMMSEVLSKFYRSGNDLGVDGGVRCPPPIRLMNTRSAHQRAGLFIGFGEPTLESLKRFQVLRSELWKKR